jgi:MerR family copper efflux transcriptional regulator
MNIGEASAASGVSSKMIRYYEQIGLIRAAARTESGYRVYAPVDIETLRFIRRARDLGFSVEEMKTLLALWQDKQRESSDVKRIALQHVGEIERRIEELEGMARALRHLAGHCHGDGRPDCPILDDLAGPSDEAGKRAPRRAWHKHIL